MFSGFLVDRPVCAEDDWHGASAVGLHLGGVVAGDALGLHNAYLRPALCQGEQVRLLVGVGVLNPCLLFVYDSPLLARCNVVMKPVPNCIMSHDTVKLGMYAVLYVVLVHSGTT